MAEEFKPHIGKNVIETLTLGMYEDPRFIFREYIQNSADQIDIAVEEGILEKRNDGIINIDIDKINKTIVIEDNATGIKSDQIRKFLGDVANSEKDINKRKGFRGIGRLGGLGYCHQLIFETSFKGEHLKSTMILNAKLLKEIIENLDDNRDAASVISVITNIKTEAATEDSHYFKVSLISVTSSKILDIEYVKEYLTMVVPVAFAPEFKFGKIITDYFKEERHFTIEEYHIKIKLNNTPIYKAYKNTLQFTKGDKLPAEITSIGYFDVKDDEQELLAIGWYGISTKINNVIDKVNYERGIRIRKNNITIGNEETLFKRFKVERTNLRYIGEIHIMGNVFIPNARRDYFNESKSLDQFEKSLEVIFDNFESKLPHIASNLHTRIKTIKNCRNLIQQYKNQNDSFETPVERDQRIKEVGVSFLNASKATLVIEKIKQEAGDNFLVNDLFKSIVGEFKYKIEDEEFTDILTQKVIPPIKFNGVNEEINKILNEVVIFLQDELGHREAAPLITKLKKKYD